MRSNDIEVIHGDEDEDEAESQAHASRATHYTSAFGLFYALLVVPVCGKSRELHVSGKWVRKSFAGMSFDPVITGQLRDSHRSYGA